MGTSAVKSRYQATANGDCNRLRTLVCAWFVKWSNELYKCAINPITNPNPVYNHTHTHYIFNPISSIFIEFSAERIVQRKNEILCHIWGNTLNIKSTIFLDMALCSSVDRYNCFGRTCCLHFQGLIEKCGSSRMLVTASNPRTKSCCKMSVCF
jgi:hypothetical protein